MRDSGRLQAVLAGELQGRYQLLGLLGRGGMGAVFRARELATGREVAIKAVADPLLAGDSQRARLRREAELLARVEHPGVVKILDCMSGTLGPLVVLELVEGARPLHEAWAERDLRGRVELVRDTARAVGAAHRAGVVHRDLKPENLLVDGQGRVRVLDFGLAISADVQRLTQSGVPVGTPQWMAPEQVAGARHEVGPPTDVWAMGVLLYEALSGQLPFPGPGLMELVGQIATGRVSPLRDPAIPRALEAICRRCLEVSPGARHRDGQALADALDAWLAGRTGGPRPGWLVVAAALALLGGAGAWLAVEPDTGPAAAAPSPQAPPAPAPVAVAPPEAPASEPPAPQAPPRPELTLRCELPRERSTSLLAFLSPTRLLAFGDRRLALCELDQEGALLELRQWTYRGRGAVALLPGQDGEHVYAADRGGSLLRFELEAGDPSVRASGLEAIAAAALATPPGASELLAVCDDVRARVLAWGPQALEPRAEHALGGDTARALALSRDGGWLLQAYGSSNPLEGRQGYEVRPAGGGEAVLREAMSVAPCVALALPGGEGFAIGDQLGGLVLVLRQGSEWRPERLLGVPPTSTARGLAASADGRLYAAWSSKVSQQLLAEWDLARTDRAAAVRVLELPERPKALALSPDGRWLVVSVGPNGGPGQRLLVLQAR